MPRAYRKSSSDSATCRNAASCYWGACLNRLGLSPSPAQDTRPAAALSVAELRDLFATVVSENALIKPAAPATLTQGELARELRTSTRTIRTLVKEGLPQLRLADSPRYELAHVLAWLRDREKQQRAE
jgi:hypothetical protein